MKTKWWICLFSALLLICAALSLWLLRPQPDAAQIQIISDGKVLHTLSLSKDQELTIRSTYGTNTVTIKNGQVAVTASDCPDHLCQHRGWCDGGTQIVCLPHRLVITFLGDHPIDGVAG